MITLDRALQRLECDLGKLPCRDSLEYHCVPLTEIQATSDVLGLPTFAKGFGAAGLIHKAVDAVHVYVPSDGCSTFRSYILYHELIHAYNISNTTLLDLANRIVNDYPQLIALGRIQVSGWSTLPALADNSPEAQVTYLDEMVATVLGARYARLMNRTFVNGKPLVRARKRGCRRYFEFR